MALLLPETKQTIASEAVCSPTIQGQDFLASDGWAARVMRHMV